MEGARVSLIRPNHGSSPRAFPTMRATPTPKPLQLSRPGLWSPFVRNPELLRAVALTVTSLKESAFASQLWMRVRVKFDRPTGLVVARPRMSPVHSSAGSFAREGTSIVPFGFFVTYTRARWVNGGAAGGGTGLWKMITSPEFE